MSAADGGRGRLRTLVGLYGSPGRVWAMARKARRVWAEHGSRGLIARARHKLERPTLPLELLGEATSDRLTFEDRWVRTGDGLCREHSVTAIILTRGNQALLEGCLGSVARSVDREALLDIVVVTNGGPVRPPDPFPFAVRVLAEGQPFNWSAYNNRAASGVQGEFLLFLNDDVEALHGGWLDVMLAVAVCPDVGVVGATLLFPEGRIQHFGIELGLGGEAGHRYKFHARKRTEGNAVVDAVTGACLLTRRALFEEVGGFDQGFPLSYNDVDYCLRTSEVGRKVVVCAEAELLHLETATRSLGASSQERERFRRRWKTVLDAKDRRLPDPAGHK